METYKSLLPVDKDGYYGRFGGAYIPEILHKNVENLLAAFHRYVDDPEFNAEFELLLRDYVGRPSPLYRASRMSRMASAWWSPVLSSALNTPPAEATSSIRR